MFSPTHGYAWLAWENGNFTLTRKIRDYEPRHWLSSRMIEASDAPPTRTYRGRQYQYHETSAPQIAFMEDEFNWLPKLGKKPAGIVMRGPDAMLAMRAGETENEVELTRLLPRDPVLADLGIAADAVAPAQFHPLTPYVPMREETTMGWAFGLSALASVILAVTFWALPVEPVLNLL